VPGLASPHCSTPTTSFWKQRVSCLSCAKSILQWKEAKRKKIWAWRDWVVSTAESNEVLIRSMHALQRHTFISWDGKRDYRHRNPLCAAFTRHHTEAHVSLSLTDAAEEGVPDCVPSSGFAPPSPKISYKIIRNGILVGKMGCLNKKCSPVNYCCLWYTEHLIVVFRVGFPLTKHLLLCSG
jgi:hypothetical protein